MHFLQKTQFCWFWLENNIVILTKYKICGFCGNTFFSGFDGKTCFSCFGGKHIFGFYMKTRLSDFSGFEKKPQFWRETMVLAETTFTGFSGKTSDFGKIAFCWYCEKTHFQVLQKHVSRIFMFWREIMFQGLAGKLIFSVMTENCILFFFFAVKRVFRFGRKTHFSGFSRKTHFSGFSRKTCFSGFRKKMRF